ncbi:MAG: ATP-binding protein [Planctomycetes bacterium]|nr:ATP-binding protein [Planctomycetota bacterium]
MIERVYTKRLLEMLAVFPVVAVIGPRQVGKSTLVLSEPIARNRRYVTLDDLTSRTLAEKDPLALVEQAGPLTIDEIQLVPGLLRGIKQQVDKDRSAGRYLITGSADLNSCADLSHVLAGRVGVLPLPPITYFEEHGMQGIPLWAHVLQQRAIDPSIAARSHAESFNWNRLLTGGFPPSLTAQSDSQRTLWLEAFRTTYLERDLRRLSDIGHLAEFARLMELSAARTGQLLNQAELARDAGLSPATAGRYLSILEASFLIQRLAPYYENIGKRLVKSAKLYWKDTGLVCHLLGIRAADLAAHRLKGALFETFVFGEIQALLPLYLPQARFYYLRAHDGLEIDGLIQQGPDLIPFEIKAAQTVTAEDAKSLRRWMSLRRHDGIGFVVYAGTRVQLIGRDIWAIPIHATTGSSL